MVASNFFGRSNNFAMISNFFEPSSTPLSKSDRVNEKSATSAPETMAEQNNKTTRRPRPKTNDTLSEYKNKTKLAGSGSNSYKIGYTKFPFS